MTNRAQGSANDRGYGRRWRERARLFKQRFPFCGMRPGGRLPVMSRCYEQGLVTGVIGKTPTGAARGQVDHVVPHRGDPRLFWAEEDNWQSLCTPCGTAKSAAGL